jgi:hypothetical protein
MEADQLSHRFPVLYHMAEDESWQSIRQIGLLSTSALLDRFGIQGDRRFDIESRRRPEIVKIEHPEHGTALIRDNKPMQETALEQCLQGMTQREWYESLNRKVFFWVDRERLSRLLGARAYRDRQHLVLEVDTAKLLKRHAKRVSLSPINSGATVFGGSPRGVGTFLRIVDHPEKKPVVELAVDYAVPDAAALTLFVSRWHGTQMLDEVWSRPS